MQVQYNKALNKVMEICSKTEHCTFDIVEKLKKYGLTSAEIDKAIKYLQAEKFIDDSRFANMYVNDKFRFNQWGKVKIKFMMRQKKIDDNIIDNAIDNIDDDEYQAVLLQIIEKKAPSVKAKTGYEKSGKLAQYAISKGFEPGLVFKLVKK